MSNQIIILNQFKDALVKFFDELISQFPEEGDLIVMRILLADQLPITEVMDYFITDLLPVKDIVKSKDEAFFLNNTTGFFDKLSGKKVNHFKKLWRKIDDKEDKEIIWKWFNSFLCLTERYVADRSKKNN